MSDNILCHMMEQNEKYRNILKEVRDYVSSIELFASDKEINKKRDDTLRNINELLEENGF
jgi:hypothetical protein